MSFNFFNNTNIVLILITISALITTTASTKNQEKDNFWLTPSA